MRKSIRNRLMVYMFYLILAVLFWLCDLTLFAWISAALVVIPILIGFVILVSKGYKKTIKRPEELDEEEEYELNPEEKEKLKTIVERFDKNWESNKK